MNASEAAYKVLDDAASDEYVALCKRAEEAGAQWVWDPEVPNVVGLIKPNTARRALVIVYIADDDFEGDIELEEFVAGS